MISLQESYLENKYRALQESRDEHELDPPESIGEDPPPITLTQYKKSKRVPPSSPRIKSDVPHTGNVTTYYAVKEYLETNGWGGKEVKSDTSYITLLSEKKIQKQKSVLADILSEVPQTSDGWLAYRAIRDEYPERDWYIEKGEDVSVGGIKATPSFIIKNKHNNEVALFHFPVSSAKVVTHLDASLTREIYQRMHPELDVKEMNIIRVSGGGDVSIKKDSEVSFLVLNEIMGGSLKDKTQKSGDKPSLDISDTRFVRAKPGSLHSHIFTVVDTETTMSGAILEVAAKKFGYNTETGELELIGVHDRFYRPKYDKNVTLHDMTPKEYNKLRKQTRKYLGDKNYHTVFDEKEEQDLRNFIEGKVITQNGQVFDWARIKENVNSAPDYNEIFANIDILQLARNYRFHNAGNSQDSLYKAATGKTMSQNGLKAHVAGQDVTGLAEIFIRLLNDPSPMGMTARALLAANDKVSTLFAEKGSARDSYTGNELYFYDDKGVKREISARQLMALVGKPDPIYKNFKNESSSQWYDTSLNRGDALDREVSKFRNTLGGVSYMAGGGNIENLNDLIDSIRSIRDEMNAFSRETRLVVTQTKEMIDSASSASIKAANAGMGNNWIRGVQMTAKIASKSARDSVIDKFSFFNSTEKENMQISSEALRNEVEANKQERLYKTLPSAARYFRKVSPHLNPQDQEATVEALGFKTSEQKAMLMKQVIAQDAASEKIKQEKEMAESASKASANIKKLGMSALSAMTSIASAFYPSNSFALQNQAESSAAGQINTTMGHIGGRFWSWSGLSHIGYGMQDMYQQQILQQQLYDQKWNVGKGVASSVGTVIGAGVGGMAGAQIGGVLGGGAAELAHGIITEGWGAREKAMRTQQWGARVSEELNIAGLAKIYLLPLRLLGDAFNKLRGISLKLFGVFTKAMTNLQQIGLPITSLTGVDSGGLQQLNMGDVLMARGAGTTNSTVESWAGSQAGLFTMGQLDTNRLVASALLGQFDTVYSNGGDTKAQRASFINNLAGQMSNPNTSRNAAYWGSLIDKEASSDAQMLIRMRNFMGNQNLTYEQMIDPRRHGGTYYGLNERQTDQAYSSRLTWGSALTSLNNILDKAAMGVWENFGKKFTSRGLAILNDIADSLFAGDFKGAAEKAKNAVGTIWNTVVGYVKGLDWEGMISNIWGWLVKPLLGQVGGFVTKIMPYILKIGDAFVSMLQIVIKNAGGLFDLLSSYRFNSLTNIMNGGSLLISANDLDPKNWQKTNLLGNVAGMHKGAQELWNRDKTGSDGDAWRSRYWHGITQNALDSLGLSRSVFTKGDLSWNLGTMYNADVMGRVQSAYEKIMNEHPGYTYGSDAWNYELIRNLWKDDITRSYFFNKDPETKEAMENLIRTKNPTAEFLAGKLGEAGGMAHQIVEEIGKAITSTTEAIADRDINVHTTMEITDPNGDKTEVDGGAVSGFSHYIRNVTVQTLEDGSTQALVFKKANGYDFRRM